MYLQNVDVVEILAGLLDTGEHGLLSLTDPDTGIVELLVGLVGALRVADLSLEVALLDELSRKEKNMCELGNRDKGKYT